MPSDFPSQLTPAEIRLLRCAASGKIIPRSDLESRLRQLGYLELHPCGTSGPWNETVYDGSVITPAGERHLEYLRSQKRIKHLESRRYWITTGIAMIALLVSIIALLQSLGCISIQEWTVWNILK